MPRYDDSSFRGLHEDRKDRLRRVAAYWDGDGHEKLISDGVARPWDSPEDRSRRFEIHLLVTTKRLFVLPEDDDVEIEMIDWREEAGHFHYPALGAMPAPATSGAKAVLIAKTMRMVPKRRIDLTVQ